MSCTAKSPGSSKTSPCIIESLISQGILHVPPSDLPVLQPRPKRDIYDFNQLGTQLISVAVDTHGVGRKRKGERGNAGGAFTSLVVGKQEVLALCDGVRVVHLLHGHPTHATLWPNRRCKRLIHTLH